MLQVLHLKSVLSQLCSLCSDLPEREEQAQSPICTCGVMQVTVSHFRYYPFIHLMDLKVLFFTATIYCHQKMSDLEQEGCKAAICGEDTAAMVFQSHPLFQQGFPHTRGPGDL